MNQSQKEFYKVAQGFMRPVFDVFIDTSIQHPEWIPEEGPFVLVANHRSDQDPLVLTANVPRPISWLGGSYLWNIPILKGFINGIGAIPVSRFKKQIHKALEVAEEVIAQGDAIGILPEGWDYIAENLFDWRVGKFKTGFARIAIKTGAPVLPVAMMGLDETRGAQPFAPFLRKMLDYPFEMQYIKDRCVYRKLHINIGKPIPPPEVDVKDREAVKAFTDQVQQAVTDLYNAIPTTVVGFEMEPKPAGPRVEEPRHEHKKPYVVEEDPKAYGEEYPGVVVE